MTIEVPEESQRGQFVASFQLKADFDKWSRRVLFPALGALIFLEIAILVSAFGVSSYGRVALIVSLASIALTFVAVAGAYSIRRALSILTAANAPTAMTPASDQENQSSILLRALEVFGDSERALAWMREENPALDNETPLHALQTEEGRVGVLNILGRIEHGVIS